MVLGAWDQGFEEVAIFNAKGFGECMSFNSFCMKIAFCLVGHFIYFELSCTVISLHVMMFCCSGLVITGNEPSAEELETEHDRRRFQVRSLLVSTDYVFVSFLARDSIYAIARYICYRPSDHLFVRHTGGSVKNR